MAENARGIHVSPGIYAKEVDMNYAVKSLGITTLGLVGETKKGPAFQPMSISNWREFQDVFGGTSAEKFVGSQYPKYELPYIAKTYLSESNQLEVCRVLGLSGYNAGPAWILTATITSGKDAGKQMAVAVLRARGEYEKYVRYDALSAGDCGCPTYEYDKLTWAVGDIDFRGVEGYCKYARHCFGNAVQIKNYTPFQSSSQCDGISVSAGDSNLLGVSSSDYGHFKIVGIKGQVHVDSIQTAEAIDTLTTAIYEGRGAFDEYAEQNGYGDVYFEYSVSLNPNDKDYILKVLGTNPQDGDAPLFVESLFDVAYEQLVDEGKVNSLNAQLAFYDTYYAKDFCQIAPVHDFLTIKEENLSRKDLGKRFLCYQSGITTCHIFDYESGKFEFDGEDAKIEQVQVGDILTVKQFTDKTNKRHFYYAKIDENTTDIFTGVTSAQSMTIANDKLVTPDQNVGTMNSENSNRIATIVKNLADEFYYRLDDEGNIVRISCDLNNYKTGYRFASTPWIVSEMKGDFDNVQLNRLFRFHTITDGDCANNEVKVSIANIRPDEGTFDVIIRAIGDSDTYVKPLETYTKCDLTPGSSRYLGYLIGTYDGNYEAHSKYVTVEINENLTTKNSIPAGFMGYPIPAYGGDQIYATAQDELLEVKDASGNTLYGNTQNTRSVIAPKIAYNTVYQEEVKNKRQYFGLSDLTGVDIDLFTYKGFAAYVDDDPDFLTQGFHLDSRMDASVNDNMIISVDGQTGYTFDTVSLASATETLDGIPMIASEADMYGSIYENVNLRKFTVYFYGGFDGWDVYRDARTTGDDFKANKYRGEYSQNSGEGYSFNRITDSTALGLNQPGITSDWYAYLTGIRAFSNPEEVDINVFATPGIDIINDKSLVEEAIDMIEEERADSIYVATLPDKPYGASDFNDEMYSAQDIVDELETTEIDSNYTCVYYPWVKYYDEVNSQYINLPVTKDVVKNMALTDNTTAPWFAPAGISRGDVNCVYAHTVTKLSDEDTLYEGRINPVKTFANDGVKIWGQKNLQVAESQLNRIAVRRLLLRMRKLIAIACRSLIFDPNDKSMKNAFISLVTPILDNIKTNRGISDYKLEVNDSQEARDRRELPAKIFFKPYNALEYITLDFVVTPEGVDFDNI